MSYYMNIVRCDLIRTDLNRSIDEIDETYIDWRRASDDEAGVVPENYFTWDDEFINDLVKLVHIDIAGEVVIRSEDGEYTKFVLIDGKVGEYEGEVVFPDEPNEVHTEVK